MAMSDENTLPIFTKSDTVSTTPSPSILTVSAQTGEGMEQLIAQLTDMVSTRYAGAGSSLITRQRHRDALEECLQFLGRLDKNKPLELNGEELRLAARALGRVTGAVSVDDILDIVFSSFCIGK